MTVNHIVISISSNTTDRLAIMNSTVEWLYSRFTVRRLSSIYEMPAINGKDASYLNAVAEVTATGLSLQEINSLFKEWETQCGRTPQSKSTGTIPMDLDLITWNDDVLRPSEFNREYFVKGYNEIMASEPGAAPRHAMR